ATRSGPTAGAVGSGCLTESNVARSIETPRPSGAAFSFHPDDVSQPGFLVLEATAAAVDAERLVPVIVPGLNVDLDVAESRFAQELVHLGPRPQPPVVGERVADGAAVLEVEVDRGTQVMIDGVEALLLPAIGEGRDAGAGVGPHAANAPPLGQRPH